MPRSLAILALAASLLGGCLRSDANMILSYTAASFEGGYEVALLNQRVWGYEQSCDEIALEDNEIWVVWSHVGRPEEFGDAFLISDRLVRETAHIAAADDGIHVYYAFDDFAEVADRYGRDLIDLGEGMGEGSFHGSKNLLIAEGPDSLVRVDVNEVTVEQLGVTGTSPSFSPDAGSIAYGRDGHAWRYEFEEGTEEDLGEAERPRYTDDGRIVALVDGPGGFGIHQLEDGVSGWAFVGEADAAVFDDGWFRLAPDGMRVLHSPKAGKFQLQEWAGPDGGDWTMTSDLVCD